MPFYDYLCEGCGHFRQRRALAECGDLQLCPTCNAPAVKIFTTPFLAGKGRDNNDSKMHAFSCGHGPGCSHKRFGWPKS